MSPVVIKGEQGTPEWHRLRCDIPTASCFDRIVTASGKPSSQADQYLNECIAGWISGKPYGDWEGNAHTERGHEFEPQARSAYEMVTGEVVTQVSFVFKDKQRLVGCSPDGLIYDGKKLRKGTEIKCPIDTIFLAYDVGGECPKKYIPQLQGSMWVAGVPEWDFVAYHEDWQPFIVTVAADPAFQRALDEHIPLFIERMLEKREDPRIKAMRELRLEMTV